VRSWLFAAALAQAQQLKHDAVLLAASTLLHDIGLTAFVKPIRKLFYNMTITAVSVLVALIVGGLEVLGLIAEKFDLQGGVWDVVGALNDNFGALGYLIVAIFALSWIISVAIYRMKGYDEIEVRIG
jgi:high-affinity nickel-transport protein